MITKEAFEQKIEAQLKQMSIEIENLLNWADEVEVDFGGEIKRAVEEICERWTDVEREWNCIRTAGEEGWEHLQYRIEVALRDLKLAIEPAMARFRQLSPTNAVSLANSS